MVYFCYLWFTHKCWYFCRITPLKLCCKLSMPPYAAQPSETMIVSKTIQSCLLYRLLKWWCHQVLCTARLIGLVCWHLFDLLEWASCGLCPSVPCQKPMCGASSDQLDILFCRTQTHLFPLLCLGHPSESAPNDQHIYNYAYIKNWIVIAICLFSDKDYHRWHRSRNTLYASTMTWCPMPTSCSTSRILVAGRAVQTNNSCNSLLGATWLWSKIEPCRTDRAVSGQMLHLHWNLFDQSAVLMVKTIPHNHH